MGNNTQVALNCELVGIKRLKSIRTWRLEFDVYETDEKLVKELFDIVERPVVLAIVENTDGR